MSRQGPSHPLGLGLGLNHDDRVAKNLCQQEIFFSFPFIPVHIKSWTSGMDLVEDWDFGLQKSNWVFRQ